MKKKLLKNTALLAAFACIAGGALPTVNAFASAKTTKYGDDFNNMEQVGDYDRSLWSAYSANGGENTSVKVEALKAASTACKMTGIGSANGEEVALTTKDKISDLKQLTFDDACKRRLVCARFLGRRKREVRGGLGQGRSAML